MDEKQAIASSVLTMQSQTRGKAELTLRLLQASDTYTVLGDDSRFVVVSNDDAFDGICYDNYGNRVCKPYCGSTES